MMLAQLTKRTLALSMLCFAVCPLLLAADFRRGDANSDGTVNIADPIFLLNYLFSEGSTPPCMDAADTNDDGSIDLSDAIFNLNMLKVLGAPPVPPPGAQNCGVDPTDDLLDCLDDSACP